MKLVARNWKQLIRMRIKSKGKNLVRTISFTRISWEIIFICERFLCWLFHGQPPSKLASVDAHRGYCGPRASRSWKFFSNFSGIWLEETVTAYNYVWEFLVYNAYLIVNNTYITNQFSNGTIKRLSNLKFGPQKPNWMTPDYCKCVGTVTDNSALSPWHLTTIAVCLLIEDRVFWTMFSNDTGFLFAKTLTPPTEGTAGLSLADYHRMYSNDILIDQLDFNVPSQCTL